MKEVKDDMVAHENLESTSFARGRTRMVHHPEHVHVLTSETGRMGLT
jgi:hypothetical protein